MQKASQFAAIPIGLAMFSMYFGAGNIAFPIALGQYAGNKNIFAIIGLILTAVIVPFLGLCVMLMYNADYDAFLGRLGRIPGLIIAGIIMALIGPFGAMPRCVSLSFSTMQIYFPNMQAIWYCALAGLVIFVLSYKKSSVMDILGKFLTPILLCSLAVIIALGLYSMGSAENTNHLPADVFLYGLKEGYNTMDIFASIFFAIVVIPAFTQVIGKDLESKPKEVSKLAIKSSLVGASLLAFIYTSMSFIAAAHTDVLENISTDKYLGSIANHILGPMAGLIANLAVSLACLTTAISLAVVFAEYLRREIFQEKIPYAPLLILTVVINYFFSLLGFSGIVSLVAPALVALCPATIVLVFCNMAYKLWGFKYVKIPVYGTFILTLIMTFI